MTAEALGRLISEHFGAATATQASLGVAVSGGGDSLALLHLLKAWGGPLRVVTVDHGLRAEAAGEALGVAEACAALNVPHDILRWDGWDGQGNLSARARAARYALMRDWALGHGLSGLALGHTAEDQAETVLMRLARRAGVDGLSGMSAKRGMGKMIMHRPLLAARREALRDYLRGLGVAWVDDPSNTDGAFRRVQARRALEALEPLGLTVEALCDVAGHLAEARETLAQIAAAEADKICRVAQGDVLIDPVRFSCLRPDIARRIMEAVLRWITGADYGPRGAETARALAKVAAQESFTLAGCRITMSRGEMRVTREYRAAERAVPSKGGVWDNRWTVSPAPEGAEWRALGPEGRTMMPDWRQSGVPVASIEASPALWQGAEILAAPLGQPDAGHGAELCRSAPDLRTLILSH
ncbi:tRNA lysidine(34) synthetase TilS [Roseovarius sp. LXJ103]|uniref:tRNA lysidine(34) synthetase TilS n=1 Tax=Roseovarius carneus TaxID=2853164 RepID=UPI0015E81A08|nr:tRNA lysidine(34) synthetase TilS [Roseovarius carneus]MBZ8118594.1 tRNA lysidine(34) synthetase TilS [Roseovarius carneus]